jgi:hypothetical protein
MFVLEEFKIAKLEIAVYAKALAFTKAAVGRITNMRAATFPVIGVRTMFVVDTPAATVKVPYYRRS